MPVRTPSPATTSRPWDSTRSTLMVSLLELATYTNRPRGSLAIPVGDWPSAAFWKGDPEAGDGRPSDPIAKPAMRFSPGSVAARVAPPGTRWTMFAVPPGPPKGDPGAGLSRPAGPRE